MFSVSPVQRMPWVECVAHPTRISATCVALRRAALRTWPNLRTLRAGIAGRRGSTPGSGLSPLHVGMRIDYSSGAATRTCVGMLRAAPLSIPGNFEPSAHRVRIEEPSPSGMRVLRCKRVPDVPRGTVPDATADRARELHCMNGRQVRAAMSGGGRPWMSVVTGSVLRGTSDASEGRAGTRSLRAGCRSRSADETCDADLSGAAATSNRCAVSRSERSAGNTVCHGYTHITRQPGCSTWNVPRDPGIRSSRTPTRR
jgi:hypothetical protein